jgi:hypothetical protein
LFFPSAGSVSLIVVAHGFLGGGFTPQGSSITGHFAIVDGGREKFPTSWKF